MFDVYYFWFLVISMAGVIAGYYIGYREGIKEITNTLTLKED